MRRSEEGRRGKEKGGRVVTRISSGQILGLGAVWSREKRTCLVLWAGNPVQTKDVSISSGDIVSLSSVALGRDQTNLGRKGNE